MDYGEVMKDIVIDPFNLEGEWLLHTEICQKWIEMHHDVAELREDFGSELEDLKEELDYQLRFNFGQFGYEKKPTEKEIIAKIKANPRVRELKEKYQDLYRAEKRIASTRYNVEKTRRRSLERIQEGITSGIFSNPRDFSKKKERKRRQLEEFNEANNIREMLNQRRQRRRTSALRQGDLEASIKDGREGRQLKLRRRKK